MSHVVKLSQRARVRALALSLLGAVTTVSAWPARVFAQGDSVGPAHINRPLNLVVAGVDYRGPAEPENTDVLMIARVDLLTRTVHAISIPRDLYVEIPGYGYDKITRAYDYGSKADGGKFKAGSDLTKQTVTASFGVSIDGMVMTTFEGFAEIVDALGGIDVDNPYEVYDAEYPTADFGVKTIDFAAGPIHLSGEQALEFSRTRHQDGDDGRVMRQHLALRAMLDRARDPQIAADLPSIVVAHRSAVRTDLGPSKQLAFALAAPDFTNDGVGFTTLTEAGLVYPDTAPNGMWIYSGDWNQIPSYVENFLAGS